MSWVKKASQGISWSTDSGNLVITATPEYQKELQEMPERTSDTVMAEVFESMIANSDFDWIRPEEVGALTSAPIIGQTERDDHGDIQKVYSVYWFPNYAVTSPIDELAEKGTTTFTNAGEIESNK